MTTLLLARLFADALCAGVVVLLIIKWRFRP